MIYLFFAFLAGIPVAFWAWFFLSEERENYHLALATFFIGTLSVVPLLLYKQLFMDGALSNTGFWYEIVTAGFVDTPGLHELAQFLLLFAIMAGFAFIIAMLIVLISTLFSMHTLRNSLHAVLVEMGNFTLFGFVALGLVLASLFESNIMAVMVASTVFLASVEEYSKHLIVRFVDDDQFKSIDNALIFSVLAGLAFAFTENIFYFSANWGTSGFIGVLIVRSVLLVFAHAMFSGIFGYFYGMGHFAQPLLVERMVSRPTYFFKKTIAKLMHLKSEPTYREQKMMEGLVLAVLFHATFNLLIQFDFLMGAFLLIIGGGVWLFYLLGKKENHKKFGLIGTRWVPNQVEFIDALNKVRDAKKQAGIDPDKEEN